MEDLNMKGSSEEEGEYLLQDDRLQLTPEEKKEMERIDKEINFDKFIDRINSEDYLKKK